MPRVAIHTLGCKLNYAESSTIGRQFLDRGFDVVAFGQAADVHVINTCAVTARANQECRQMIRRALRVSPESFVIVTGCYAQLDPDQVGGIEGVDLVLGTNEKFRVFELGGDLTKLSCARIHVSDVGEDDLFHGAATTEAGGRTRSFLKVQDGCDYACSYCTIPLARGRSRSEDVAATVVRAKELVASGFREIVLTGVNVGDYGRSQGVGLIGLLHSLSEIKGLLRLRISSIEPNLLTDEIIDLMSTNPLFCKHVHVPMQSGSDAVLRGMRRRYDAETYCDRILQVKESIPECGIGADVIVGFPGETDEFFWDTHELIARLPLTYLHVFTYSERPNTIAAALPGKVAPAERSRRNGLLRALGEQKRQAFLRSLKGSTEEVLMESDIDGALRFGYTGTYARVGIDAGDSTEGELVRVRIREVQPGYCLGDRERHGR